MSYFIFYEEQFIKVKNKYIPLVLGGDNNVYDCGYKGKDRRSRSWSSFIGSSKIFWEEKELFDYVEQVRTSILSGQKKRNETDYQDKSFGYYSGCSVKSKHPVETTFADFKNIVNRGIKFALTLEDLNSRFHRELKVTVNCYDKEDNYLGEQFGKWVSSTEHLIETLKEIDEKFRDTKHYIHFSLSMSEETVKRIRKTLRKEFNPNPQRIEKKEVSHYFVIQRPSSSDSFHYYLEKITSRRLLGVRQLNFARKFKTEKEAQRILNKIHTRFTNGKEFEIIKVENTTGIKF